MTLELYRRNTPLLVALLVPAGVYLTWQHFAPTLTGIGGVDGGIGVVLGLFICSRPAANGIDLIFFERGGLRLAFSGWSGVEWFALNLLVMFTGWIVIDGTDGRTKTYADPASIPPTLSSQSAPTNAVSPDTATETPNPSAAAASKAVTLACWLQTPAVRTKA